MIHLSFLFFLKTSILNGLPKINITGTVHVKEFITIVLFGTIDVLVVWFSISSRARLFIQIHKIHEGYTSDTRLCYIEHKWVSDHINDIEGNIYAYNIISYAYQIIHRTLNNKFTRMAIHLNEFKFPFNKYV